MTERPRTMSKAASMNSMNVDSTGHEKRSSSLFGMWKSRSSLRRDGNRDGAPQHVGLEGKELRDAVWKQQRHRESHPHAPVRPMRVIRYSPPRGSPTVSADEADDDDDEFSNPDSTRGTGHPMTYDGVDDMSRSRLGSSRVKHDDPSASRLSLTFSRLSFSSSARNSLADYKAKKYDVEWKRDDEVPDCQVCHLAFTKWSRRRHHCRVCGDIICDDCSPDQVHIDGRFTRAKRACNACVELLEAMMYLGDARVKMVVEKEVGSREWIDMTPVIPSDRVEPVVYHDRLVEIQRVTAAGTKAKRQATHEVRQCVIQAKWLRSWLAFSRNEADDSTDEYQLKKIRAESTLSTVTDGEAPGPIDNLSLLMMRKGQLVPRVGLVRVENEDFAGSSGPGRGDYQTIPLEVWDVLSRYYGGGPRIEIVPSHIAGEPDRWVVDITAVVRGARAHKTNPHASRTASSPPLTVEEKIVERALMERHDPFSIMLDVPANSNRPIYDPIPVPTDTTTMNTTPSLPTYNRSVSDSTAFIGSTRSPTARVPNSDARSKREPQRSHPSSATPSTKSQPSGRRKPEPEREPTSSTDPNRRQRQPSVSRRNEPTRRSNRGGGSTTSSSNGSSRQEPIEATAASAASAFALAMKQARLKQQRAIAGGRSRPTIDS